MKKRLPGRATLAAGLGLLVLGGCGERAPLLPGATNQPPTVTLRALPQPADPRELGRPVYYVVNLQWEATDSDGQVEYFLYAVDPPAEGDSAWTRCDESQVMLAFRAATPDSAALVVPYPLYPATSHDYHVFVVKAVDDGGAFSPPAHVAFTAQTVAPATTIQQPIPSHLTMALTTPNVTITWSGQDPDGQLSQQPVRYRFKLVSQTTVQQKLGLGTVSPSQGDLQTFFSEGLPEAFATWDSVPAESTSRRYENLTPGQVLFFAISAVDEASAYEPRFRLDANLLRFKPELPTQAPALCVFNPYFSRCQGRGSFDLSESRVVRLEVPEGDPVTISWDGTPVEGTEVTGYRWCLDIEDIFDETPRDDPSQTDRWSEWSLQVTSATVGPFYVEIDDSTEPPTIRDTHRFYVEARDDLGMVSIMIVELRAVAPQFQDLPADQRRILVFDDVRANTDRNTNGLKPYGVFPTESMLDSILFAVGGHPFKYSPFPLSKPGVFAGFPYDTLDYRFTPVAGLPLSTLVHYNAVVWYTQALDAGLAGGKFSSSPEGALRFINKAGESNTLALYLAQGGQAWLFGDGLAPAVANGYVIQFGLGEPAFFPYTGAAAGDPGPSESSILWPGDFLYDYLKVQSQMDKIDNAGAGDILSDADELVGMTPYLPEYRTPGAPWPPEGPPPVTERGPADDPRVGPSSSRHVGRWAGLPMLTMTTEFADWPTALPISTKAVPYVSLPNEVTEGSPGVSVLDTLYLYRGKQFVLRAASDWPDGKPVWFHYWGAAHGQVNWTSAPIWLFERTQLQLVADRILAQFGFTRNPDPRAWTGPGRVREGRERGSVAARP